MTAEPLYLRQDVQVEPLIDRWYAWSQLIPPATAARNMTERHFKIMDSYISAPQVHANAVSNPLMSGGPFIDYRGQRVSEIRALREDTARKRGGLTELSNALDQLDHLLQTRAKGQSMHPLYPAVPEMLRGYVELTYDGSLRPAFRIIEPLLYRSDYYDRSAQSILLSLTGADDRPFVLSTPRLAGPGLVDLQWHFDDSRIDRLFRLKQQPEPWNQIRADLDLTNEVARNCEAFFTPEPPRRDPKYDGPGAKWRYFGHACILVETTGFSILVDPVLSYTYESKISRYTYQDLPDEIDYVLITHNHQDHILFETLLQLRHKIKTIVVPRNGSGSLVDPSLRLILENTGFRNVVEISEMDTVELGPGNEIVGLPFLGEHSDLAIGTKLAYLVRLGDVRLLFAADSCNIEPALYRHLHRAIGNVDVLFLGMECQGAPLSWLYGPLLFQRPERSVDESRRLNGCDFEQARKIVDEFSCREVYVYAMGQEPWLNYIMSLKYTEQSRPIVESNRLLGYCQERGIVAERLFGEKEILMDVGLSR